MESFLSNVNILDILLVSYDLVELYLFFSGADGEPLQEEDYFLSNPYHLVRSYI
jgi:hypothetical protein